MRTKDEHLPAEKIITFADPLDMAACLTVERVRLVQTARTGRLNISALAVELGRNRGSVTRDVMVLVELGLVRLRRENNPAGRGIVQIVEAVAGRLNLRVNI
jgi:predicted transcriptional regulator